MHGRIIEDLHHPPPIKSYHLPMLYTLYQTVDQAAERHPEKDAFCFRSETLSYGVLSQRTNQLAHVLIRSGVMPGDRVAIYLSKCLECAVAIHGIMKAGAAYVPLDPTAPAERLAAILRDCAVEHLVTHDARRRQVTQLMEMQVGLKSVVGLSKTENFRCPVISWDDVAAEEMSWPDVGVMEQDLGYIIYTSGSTGTPKGIMHTHASGLAYARMAAHLYELTPEDRLSNFPPLHFDQSTFDYFCGPLVGATTVIIPEEYTKLPASLSQLIQDARLTVWYSVPFALVQLLLRGVLQQRDLSALRWIIYGGEPFPLKYLRALQELLPAARFSNNYGPAETNQCTFYMLPRQTPLLAESVPIGNPCPNTSILVVDEHDRQVPATETGELLVRTATMMLGYWNRPELNERAFYFCEKDGGQVQRFYRTGDLVLLGEDGLLYFLGRKDRQVKSRGYRIELDEIEATLLTHPKVVECAVFPKLDEDENSLIYAAVILETDATVGQGELLKYMGQRLPSYAVPLQVAQLQAFPRTTSNKIDRRALQKTLVL